MQFSFCDSRIHVQRPKDAGRWKFEAWLGIWKRYDLHLKLQWIAHRKPYEFDTCESLIWYDLITSQETVRTWQDLIARILPSTACRVFTKQNRQAVMPSNYRCSVFLVVACLLDDWICFKWQHIFCWAHVLTRRGGKWGHPDHPGFGWFRL